MEAKSPFCRQGYREFCGPHNPGSGNQAEKVRGPRPDSLDCSGARVMFPDTTRMGQREEERQGLRQGEMRENRGRDRQQGG